MKKTAPQPKDTLAHPTPTAQEIAPDKPANGSKAAYELAKSMNDASIDGMLVLNPALQIVAWNTVLAHWSGWQEAAVTGKDFFAIFEEAKTPEGIRKAFHHALQGRKSFLGTNESFPIPGYYEMHIVPLHQGEAVAGILVILHDVAHRVKTENQLKALNQQLLRQNAELRQAHEEMGVFARIAAHDLKEPLRKIYTFSELIVMNEGQKMGNSSRSNFRRIQKSVQRMGLLIDDLVNFADLSRKGVFEEVDLSQLLTGELQKRKEAIEEAQAAVCVQLDQLPTLRGNVMALQQLLQQLLSNALKFRRPDAAPQIRIAYEKVAGSPAIHPVMEEGRPYHCVFVEDNGIGFEPQYREQIFELFQRLHPKEEYSGSGMGLAIARKAMGMHGGFIRAESTPGQGSIFYCYFPEPDGQTAE